MDDSWLHVLYLMLNLQEGDNELKSVGQSFTKVTKFVLTQQLLTSLHSLMESGDDVVTGSVVAQTRHITETTWTSDSV